MILQPSNNRIEATEDLSIRYVKGIGPKRAEALNRLGIQTLRQLCYFFPRTYQDRSDVIPISALQPGNPQTIKGKVLDISMKRVRFMGILEMLIGDESGAVTAIWFNQNYLRSKFEKGQEIILSGKLERYLDRLQFNSPDYELVSKDDESPVHAGRITPIYPLTEGLNQRSLRTAMKLVIDFHLNQEVNEFLPPQIRTRQNLIDLRSAMKTIHFPESFAELEDARRRIVFDEFFIFECKLLTNIRQSQLSRKAIALKNGTHFLQEYKKALPFTMTPDQELVIEEILNGVSQEIPMNRLLQGDVGSGKTVVAAFFLALAAKNGYQGALVAPTEILAEQHCRKLTPLFKQFKIETALLTGSSSDDEKQVMLRRLAEGKLHIVIGTHALLQDHIQFKQMSMVVIDEQHRFGVEQRTKLVQRDPRPHLLVMTATPIPRTLGLTLYGDLDISTIRSLPSGRKPVKTYWISEDQEKKVLDHIKKIVLKEKQQAYFLYPIIEQNERLELKAAVAEYERLKKKDFKELSVGLVHGKMTKREREQVMQDFYRNKIQVLVATSVIEVGVDNPNVTFMVIKNSDRFGLAQLHQMRGRIGRGDKESACFLFGSPTTEEGKKRLRLLTKLNDGFELAEEDLKLRGPGDFLGTEQSGFPLLGIGDFAKDHKLLIEARSEAKKIIAEDPDFDDPENTLLRLEIERRQHGRQGTE